MIISDKYKYVFVELPLTASTAISKELRQHYDGSLILHKHATYDDFLRHASNEQKNYFVFGSIRNPIDKAVSHYFKYKTDHRTAFSKPRRNPRKKIFTFLTETHLNRIRYQFIQDQTADFTAFFKAFYKLPYSDWSILSHKEFDFVIRFENLQNDFAETITRLGISLVRELPLRNKTSEKDTEFTSYYTSDIIPLAKRVFGLYMAYWDYDFPKTWGEYQPTRRDRFYYAALNIPRVFYWRHMRNRF